MSKLILLNGGKGSGKTDASEMLEAKYGAKPRRCKDKLHRLVMELFCVDPDIYWDIYNNREKKESPNPLFTLKWEELVELCYILKSSDRLLESSENFDCEYGEVSLREAMIYVSEWLCKPALGDDYFGKARVASMKPNEVAIDDSSGFIEELYPAIAHLGQENILLIRVKGRGDFEGDSRDFIPEGVINNTVDIWNTGTLEAYLNEVSKEVKNFLEN